MITSRIKTPHAAIMVWNYIDRVNVDGANHTTVNEVREEIISTVSCTGIQTYKSKSDPVGSFNFSLAPTRNWTAVLTPGSWCVLMMSNKPFSKESFIKADPELVKMFGKIESVRVDTVANADGTRETKYLISGKDWGQVFNDTIYIDPLIASDQEQKDATQSLFVAVQRLVTTTNNSPIVTSTRVNLLRLLGVLGKSLQIDGEPRVAKANYAIRIPQQAVDFFGFDASEMMKVIELVTGKLTEQGQYESVGAADGRGWINPFSLIGTHTLWQVMQDNANYALNEMFTDIRWSGSTPTLTIYNRVKPFSFQDKPVAGASKTLRSKFQHIPTHKLDSSLVISVNAGTTWSDKYNFIEIKPELQDFKITDVFVKQKSQVKNGNGRDVFSREGFRPLIFGIKQFPFPVKDKKATVRDLLPGSLQPWVKLLQEWYFDSHRLLNGELKMTGSTEYLAVGNNIMFDAALINVTPNYNSATSKPQRYSVLAQIESVKHVFGISNDARSFQTVVQFVRGIIVDDEKKLIGDGAIDSLSTAYSKSTSVNDNVMATNTPDSPIKE